MRAFCDIKSGVVAMMRNQMVLSRNSDHRIGSAAQFPRQDHAEDARQVGAKRYQLQIEHQLRMRSKEAGIPIGRSGSSMSSAVSFSALWIRFSTSRTESRYSLSFERSLCPRLAASEFASSATESRMLAFLLRSRQTLRGRSAVAE